MKAVKVLHIITSLHADGAQNMLLKISQNRDPEKMIIEVVSLLDEGLVGPSLIEAGIKVHSLKMKNLNNLFLAPLKLLAIINSFKPDIIQGWMYHANLVALATKTFIPSAKSIKLLWNIRRDLVELKHDKQLTKLVIKLNARFSSIPDKIIYCGEKVAVDHHAIGFNKLNGIVIPNGFCCERFFPSEEMSLNFRKSLGISKENKIVGMVGRFHPQKNYKNFVDSARIILETNPNVNFILIGKGCDWDNKDLTTWIKQTGQDSKFYLLGQRTDIPNILPAFDIFCLSSSGEGFPNVLGEAMACGVICVSTNAGVAAEIIQDANRIAPINDPESLAQKVISTLKLPEAEIQTIKKSSRKRVLENYQIDNITKKYQELYENISA